MLTENNHIGWLGCPISDGGVCNDLQAAYEVVRQLSDVTAAVSSALTRDKRQIETGLEPRITYALVESDHPYKPASVAIYNVTLWLYIVVLLCEHIFD